MTALPDGWAEARLGDILSFRYGKALADRERSGTGFPVYGSNGIVGHHTAALVHQEALIVGRKGSVGEVHHAIGPCWPIDTTYFIDNFGGMPSRYWYYLLRWLRLDTLDRATAIPGLNREDAYSRVVPLAPLSEQTRIANKLDALLSRVKSCRDRLSRIVNILKQFRQSLLAAAVNGELTREWREVKGLTKAWSESKIGDIADVGTGSTPLRSNSAFYSETGTPWITSAATGLPFVTKADRFVTDAAIVAHRLRQYPVGTLLVAMYGEGKTRGQVTELRIEATVNQACAAIVVDQEKAKTGFVRLALEANYQEMRKLAEGGSQPNLNLSKIKEFSLSLPPLDEQQAIVDRAQDIWGLGAAVQGCVENASQFADQMTAAALSKSFRGELVPQDSNDEPASEILARINRSPSQSDTISRPSKQKARGLLQKKAKNNMVVRGNRASDYLTRILKERGSQTPRDLWLASNLDIDEFYEQLKYEVSQGLLRENYEDPAATTRRLEPAV